MKPQSNGNSLYALLPVSYRKKVGITKDTELDFDIAGKVISYYPRNELSDVQTPLTKYEQDIYDILESREAKIRKPALYTLFMPNAKHQTLKTKQLNVAIGGLIHKGIIKKDALTTEYVELSD